MNDKNVVRKDIFIPQKINYMDYGFITKRFEDQKFIELKFVVNDLECALYFQAPMKFNEKKKTTVVISAGNLFMIATKLHRVISGSFDYIPQNELFVYGTNLSNKKDKVIIEFFEVAKDYIRFSISYDLKVFKISKKRFETYPKSVVAISNLALSQRFDEILKVNEKSMVDSLALRNMCNEKHVYKIKTKYIYIRKESEAVIRWID